MLVDNENFYNFILFRSLMGRNVTNKTVSLQNTFRKLSNMWLEEI